jgi:polysaccharide export outer membrane protein
MTSRILIVAGLVGFLVRAQNSSGPSDIPAPTAGTVNAPDIATYLLGAEDMVKIKVPNDEDLGDDDAFRIDSRGFVNVPRIGRVKAAGLNVEEFEDAVTGKLRAYLQNPIVTVTVTEFHSQRVSVLGAVGTPGVHLLQGQKTLFEVISEAGGIRTEAGNKIKITRRNEYGPIPLANAKEDPSGLYTVAEVGLKSVMEASNPQENILIRPNDVITVPKAELVYIVGAVRHSGGFVLSERENMSILQALSMAEGLEHTAATNRATIIRQAAGSANPTEIRLDLKKILNGKDPDVALLPNDILFVPNSTMKAAGITMAQAGLQAATAAAIYRPF